MQPGMAFLDVVAALISLAALLSYINHRFLRLPTSIGLVLSALFISLALLLLEHLGLPVAAPAEAILRGIDFNTALMHGMLSFLLFAGALHVNLNDLILQRGVITTLATGGILMSTFIVGGLSWLLLQALGIPMDLIYCLLFGALISPTDPIAVLGILKKAGVNKTLETKITGESLFNDGVGVVVFLVLLGLLNGESEATVGGVLSLLAREAGGGIVFGLILGYVGYAMLKSVDSYQVEVLLTLAMVMGGYSAAHALHLSGPIAIVVAGLMIGNQGRRLAMSEHTRERLDTFWELLDEILNAVLFVLIGLEVLVLSFDTPTLLAGLLAIPLVLAARFVSVGLPVTIMRRTRAFSPNAVKILTWGGLRGGISIALALSLPVGAERETLLAITYAVVVFSIAVQGLTVGRLVRREGTAGRLEAD